MSEIRMGYTWAPGARIGIDADAVGAELERIERAGQGVSLENIAARGADPTSPLFPYFEHDDARAAHQWRLEEAGHIVRCLRYRLVNPHTEEERPGPRVYQPVREMTDDRSRPGVYLRVTTATTPTPAPRAEAPTSFVVRPAHAPVAMAPIPLDLPAPTETVVLRPSQDRMRSMLLRLADSMADDPYFGGVVRAIRALP